MQSGWAAVVPLLGSVQILLCGLVGIVELTWDYQDLFTSDSRELRVSLL